MSDVFTGTCSTHPKDRQVERELLLNRRMTFDLAAGFWRPRAGATDLPPSPSSDTEWLKAVVSETNIADRRTAVADGLYRLSMGWLLQEQISTGSLRNSAEGQFAWLLRRMTKPGKGRPRLPAVVLGKLRALVPQAADRQPEDPSPIAKASAASRPCRVGGGSGLTFRQLGALCFHLSLYAVLQSVAADGSDDDTWAPEPEPPETPGMDELPDVDGADAAELDAPSPMASPEASTVEAPVQALLLPASRAQLAATIWRRLATEIHVLLDRAQVPGFELKRRVAPKLGTDASLKKFESIAQVEHKDGIAFAALLLDVLIAATRGQLFDLEAIIEPGNPPRTVYRALLRESLVKALRERSEQQRLVPGNAPMVEPPMAWTLRDGTADGACHARNLSFFKMRRKNLALKRFLRAVNAHHLELEGELDANHADHRLKALVPGFSAVNACQGTAWRINARVWSVVQALLDRRAELPGGELLQRNQLRSRDAMAEHFPKRFAAEEARRAFQDVGGGKAPDAAPGEPEADRWADWLQSEDFYRVKRSRGRRMAVGPGATVSDPITLATLTDAAAQERFWFGYQADLRGRIYPLAGILSPTGSDIARSLLEFADAKPLGTQAGVDALAVHGTHMVNESQIRMDLGLSSQQPLSNQDRVAWVLKVEEAIILPAAQDPLSSRQWCEVARKPFLFLAFCLSWAGYRKNGFDSLCHLPVHIDGSCNGLQHLSVLTGSEALARATNVIPTTGANGDVERQDVYALVASDTLSRLIQVGSKSKRSEKDAPLRLAVASFLIAAGHRLLTRDMAKKVVMVIPYGASNGTYRANLRKGLYAALLLPRGVGSAESEAGFQLRPEWEGDEAWRALLSALGASPPAPLNFEQLRSIVGEAARQLAAGFEKAIQARFPELKPIEDQLKRAVEVSTGAGLAMTWVTPVGQPVVQPYFKVNVFEKDLQGVGTLTVTPQDVARMSELQTPARAERLRLALEELQETLDLGSQRRGILPNIVHSLDASHMVLTVNHALKAGLRHFSVIHDSFGVHACDVPELKRCVAEAWIDLYSRPSARLASFLHWWSLTNGSLGEDAERQAAGRWARSGEADGRMRLAMLNYARKQRGQDPFAAAPFLEHKVDPVAGAGGSESAPPWLVQVRESTYFFA